MHRQRSDILQQFGINPKSETMKRSSAPPSPMRRTMTTPIMTVTPPRRASPTPAAPHLQVFLDGSCIGNGSKHAKGGYAGVFPEHPHLTFAEPLKASPGMPATNNRAEYTALIRAHEIAPPGVPMTAFTDSMLLFKTYTEWIPAWKRKGWKKADGSTVLNLDLVKRIDQIKTERSITMKHVRAHTGGTDYQSIHNAEADRLAKLAAK